jgi:hypothetical protein
MIPETGQHVKCLLRNGAIAEGIVEEWFGNYVKLISLDHGSVLIIHHPDQDIMLTKIVLDDDIAEDYKEPAESITGVPAPSDEDPPSGAFISYKDGGITWTNPEELQAEFEEVLEQPSSDPNRIKRLADLRIMMAEADRKIIEDKLKDHNINEVKKVEYGYPGFFKKSSAQQHPAPQTQGGTGRRKQRPVDE